MIKTSLIAWIELSNCNCVFWYLIKLIFTYHWHEHCTELFSVDVWKFDIHMLPHQFSVLIQFSVANYLDIENQQNTVDLRNMFVYQLSATLIHFHRFSFVPRKPMITKKRKYSYYYNKCATIWQLTVLSCNKLILQCK